MIKFSIITVCLNAGEDLKYTIDNILNQTYTNFELIIKDGLSTDGSVDNIPDDSRINFVQKKDTGIYDAMNQAIELATGEHCIFINAGDGLYEADTLQKISEFIENNEGDFYYGKSYTVSEDVIRFGPNKMTKYFCFRSTICHQAMIIKTSFLKNRGYDVNIKISADREWMVYAFIEAKMKFIKIDCIVANYKGGGISASTSSSVIKKENEIITKRYFTVSERILYRTFLILSLQKIRALINRNPKLLTLYGKLKYKLIGYK